jgi:hypothetical protein
VPSPLPPSNVEVYIAADRRADYDALKTSMRSEDLRVAAMLEKAVGVLKGNPFAGNRIRRGQIPAEYRRRYGPLPNLWKYNLSRSWRLVYTVARDAGVIVVVLEWFSHDEYERRFGY